MMDENATDEVLNELFSALESAETQNGAILQFLKDKNLATDEDLAPYLQQAGNASSVRWMAARVRIKSLLASAIRNAEQELDERVEKAVHKDETPQKEKQPAEQESQKKEIAPTQKQADTQQAKGKPGETEARKQVDARGQIDSKPAPEKPAATNQQQAQPAQNNSDQKNAGSNADKENADQKNPRQKNADQKVA
jgi:hypothetical protein